MKSAFRLTFRRGDVLAIALVVLLAAGTALAFMPGKSNGGARMAQIYRDGALVEEFSLEEDRTFEITGDFRNVITVSGGRIAITESDCPGADCVHSGWIDTAGRSIVCLPNRVEIRVTGAADVDFVVG